MGLDQGWSTVERTQFATHRKFNALEGFMRDQWASFGNEGEFNCVDLRITTEILDELKQRIEDDNLDPVEGFFFGTTEKNDWYIKNIEQLRDTVIPAAEAYLKEGKTVVYSSWW